MRTLVYGTQSSGGSWVAYCLGQSPKTIVIPDIYFFRPVPPAVEFGEQDVVFKATVDRKHPIELAIQRFEPHRVVLVVRDEDAIRESLRRRAMQSEERDWAYMRGGEEEMELKLAEMRRVVDTPSLWDDIIHLKKFCQHPRKLPRSLKEIVRYNWENCEWCQANAMPQKWGLGGIRIEGMSQREKSRLSHMVRRGPARVDNAN